MKTQGRALLVLTALMATAPLVQAKYTETMNRKDRTRNLCKDYDLVDDDAKTDQSAILLKAIADADRVGGGNIVIPKGTYCLSGITLQSDVHLLIEAGTVIKPATGVVFSLSTERAVEKKDKQAFIENVSIRGVGGPFIIDYHDRKYKDKQRAITAKMVRNFLISDMIVKDNYSVYCGISFGPSNEKKEDVSDWAVSRPTDGTVRNITHLKASPGYGLIQCHGAQSVHYENLYSVGGVTFRLEVGANNKNVGVYDLTASNITNVNGRCAVMMGPHSAKSGLVTVDGVTAISSTYAVNIGDGHVKKGAPDQTPGWFDSGSSIKNVHVVFGKEAQVKGQGMMRIPDTKYYDDMKIWSDLKFFTGPSIGAVCNQAKSFEVTVENITMEGFEFNNEQPIQMGDQGLRPGKWAQEKKAWEKAHSGAEWMSDKGVAVNDYAVEDFIK